MEKNLFLFIVMLFLISCNSRHDTQYYHSKVKNNYQLQLVDSLFFYNSDSVFISQTHAFSVWNNYILISDFQFMKVWVFDKNLHLVKAIGGEGRGPGEFLYPANIINSNLDTLYLLNIQAKKLSYYDKNFDFIKDEYLPKDFYYDVTNPIKIGNNIIFPAHYPYSIAKDDYYTKYKSLLLINKKLKFIKDFFKWDNFYFNKTYSAYAKDNANVFVTLADSNHFFALQIATFRIREFDNNLNIIKIFGCKQKYFQEPPENITLMETQKSMESVLNFREKTTRYYSMCYDTTNKNLLLDYANLPKEYWYKRTLLWGKHYLQVYDKDYNCIYDGRISGMLEFTNEGKIYVLTEENPKYIKMNVYKLVKNKK